MWNSSRLFILAICVSCVVKCWCADEECFAGWKIKNRSGPDSAGWTMVSPDKVINCDGEISEWRYQAKASEPFRAMVFRHICGGSATEFQIVGINDIPSGPINEEVTFEVPSQDRIKVKAGDVIGWSFGAGVLAFNGGGGYLVRWLAGNLHASLEPYQIRDINTGSQQREYSIQAVVESPEDDTCSTGWQVKNRGGPDSPGWTMVSPDKVINCDGEISEWRYQGKTSNPFRAIVFRHVCSGSATEFEIVGINDIPAGAINTEETFQVPANERIKVKAGDVIGWSCGTGVLTFNTGGGYRVRWLGGNLQASLQPYQTRNINQGVQPREYSIEAIVEPWALISFTSCASQPFCQINNPEEVIETPE